MFPSSTFNYFDANVSIATPVEQNEQRLVFSQILGLGFETKWFSSAHLIFCSA